MNNSISDRNKDLVLVILIVLISAIFGFVYETIFYRIDLGYFVKRGSTIGPWLPIYATGGFFVYLVNKRNKDSIFRVFILSTLVCGMLEFIVGYLLYNISNIRLWDYNTEILNYGNIGGFICLRSVLFFGLSGVFLMGVVLPLVSNWVRDNGNRRVLFITLFIGLLFMVDFVINYIII